MLIFVFKVGLAESGVSTIPALVVYIVVNSRVLSITWSLIVIAIYTVCPAATSLSKAYVRQTRSVDVDSCSTHTVSYASLNFNNTTLRLRSQGNWVPEIVKLSPPRRFNWVVGTTALTVQVIVSLTRSALLFTKPYLATSWGVWSPQTGSWSKVQVKVSFETVAASMVHRECPNSTCLIEEILAGRSVPVRTSYLVAKSYVNPVTSPSGSV